MENKTHWVTSANEFPNWREPCPECGAKYPKPAVSHRKDGSAAWCKSCGTNWKVSQFKTPPQPQNRPSNASSGQTRGIDPNLIIVEKLDQILDILKTNFPEIPEGFED